jgi:hypothetical protein
MVWDMHTNRYLLALDIVQLTLQMLSASCTAWLGSTLTQPSLQCRSSGVMMALNHVMQTQTGMTLQWRPGLL